MYKGYKRDKIEMRGDRAEMSDSPLYLNMVAGGLDCRNQTIGGFSFAVVRQIVYFISRFFITIILIQVNSTPYITNPLSLSFSSPLAVRKIIGTSHIFRANLHTVNPSNRGIIISKMIRSTVFFSKIESASTPSLAKMQECPTSFLNIK